MADADNSDLDRGKIKTSGVGLSEGELAAIDQIAEEYNVSRSSLLRLAVRLFIKGVRAGQIDVDSYYEKPAQKKLKFGRRP